MFFKRVFRYIFIDMDIFTITVDTLASMWEAYAPSKCAQLAFEWTVHEVHTEVTKARKEIRVEAEEVRKEVKKATMLLSNSCAVYSCPQHYLPKNDYAEQEGHDIGACCNKACSGFGCAALGHWVNKARASSIVGDDRDTCCEEACSGVECPANQTNKPGSDTIPAHEAACCTTACSVFSCPDDYVLRNDSGNIPGHTREECCEEALLLQGPRGEAAAPLRGSALPPAPTPSPGSEAEKTKLRKGVRREDKLLLLEAQRQLQALTARLKELVEDDDDA